MLILNKKRIIIFLLLIILGGVICYSNIFSHQFLWDDEFLIEKNQFIRSFDHLPQVLSSPSGAGAGRSDNFYRPLQILNYTGLYALAGATPWIFLLNNLFLHIFSGILIFFLIRKIFKKDFLAFLVSFFWIIHPVHTEVVTYMSGTADPLSTLLGLGSFYFYLIFREKKQFCFLIFALVSFLLALLAKETIIILPGLILFYEIIFNQNPKKISNYAPLIWFFNIALAYFCLRLSFLNFGGTLSLYATSNIYTENILVRFFTFLASLLMYYSFFFYPVNLHMERKFSVFSNWQSPWVLSSFLILVGFIILGFWAQRKNKKYISFGLGWFFLAFIPLSGIIIPINSFLLEHWLYFTSIGLFLCLAGLINALWEKIAKIRKGLLIVLLLIGILLMNGTRQRNKVWENPLTFYHDILQYHEGTARIHNNLGMAYADQNDLNKAEEHYLKAVALSDQYPQTHYNLAQLYLEKEEEEKAIIHLEKSLVINPRFFFSYYLLSQIYQEEGEIKKAQEYLQKAEAIEYY